MKSILDILEEAGGYIKDSHIVGTSGKHISEYLNKDAIYPHTAVASEVGQLMAEKVKNLEIDAVVSPAVGGVVLSQWVAYHLSKIKGREVLGIYSEKTQEGGQELKRGYDKLIVGKKVLVVEDIINTGGSAKKAVDIVKSSGGNVIGVLVMVNRNPDNVNESYFGVPLFALESRKFLAFEEGDCPMCKAGVPINTTVGHGKKYLENKKS